MPRRSASAPLAGSSRRVVTPAVIWCASETRSTPENAFSVKIESKLKSFGAESKVGSVDLLADGVLT